MQLPRCVLRLPSLCRYNNTHPIPPQTPLGVWVGNKEAMLGAGRRPTGFSPPAARRSPPRLRLRCDPTTDDHRHQASKTGGGVHHRGGKEGPALLMTPANTHPVLNTPGACRRSHRSLSSRAAGQECVGPAAGREDDPGAVRGRGCARNPRDPGDELPRRPHGRRRVEPFGDGSGARRAPGWA